MEGKGTEELSEKFSHMFWRTSLFGDCVMKNERKLMTSCNGSKLESMANHPSCKLQYHPIPIPITIPINMFYRMESVLVITKCRVSVLADRLMSSQANG